MTRSEKASRNERIADLYRQGKDVDDIADQFGLTTGYIRCLASKNGWARTRLKAGQRAGPRIARTYKPPPAKEYRPPPMVRPGGESFQDDRRVFTLPSWATTN